MILDSQWMFTGGSGGVGNNDGTTDSPTTGTQNSSNIVDVGINSGIPTSASGGGGRDLGIGDDPALKFMVLVTVTFTGGTSLQVGVQGAPDGGSGTPGSYVNLSFGPAVLEATLVAGVRVFDEDMPRQAPGANPPRFYRLTYVTVGTHNTGKLEGVLVLDRFDQVEGLTGAVSGYPAGVVVAN